MIRFSIIVAATKTNGIGKKGQLPWHIQEDLDYFEYVIQNAPAGTQNVVIMGRKTWESIPVKERPISKCFNIVISSDLSYDLNAQGPGTAALVASFEEALQVRPPLPIHRGFIIGGAWVYDKTLQSTTEFEVDRVLITRITAPYYDCDTFMPEFKVEGDWKQEPHDALVNWVKLEVPAGVQKQEDGTEYEFQLWTRRG